MRRMGAGVLAAMCALVGGCAGMASQGKWKGSTGPLFDHPFAPVALRVHPLTHVDTAKAAGGASVIVLHLELRDNWGDTAKGMGRLSVLLYKPGSGMQPGLESQELRWDVPGFEDPNENMALYDVATRTYRVQLEAPEWVGAAIHDPKGNESGWFTIRAVLSAGTDAEARYLSDEYVLQK
jgi:hypothetical protein